MSLGFGLSGGPPDWLALRDMAQMAEELGFDSVWRNDHPLLAMDCWTTLAALAQVTKRIRLGSQVACVLYRNPVLLARLAADVHTMSGGRAMLGLGAGDLESEFQRMGLTFPSAGERRAALAEALEIVPALLRGETVTFEGEHFRTANAALHPPPPAMPAVPIMIGGGGARTLSLVARYADISNVAAAAWGGGVRTAVDFTAKFEALRQRCVEVGRPYEAILRSMHFFPTLLADSPSALAAKVELVPAPVRQLAGESALLGTPTEAVERLRPFVAAGCEYFTFGPGADIDTVRLLAERVMPALAAYPSRP